MFPDQMADWLKLLGLVPGVVVAWKIPSLLGWIKMRLTKTLAGALMQQLLPVLEDMQRQLGEVRHQVFPNGGGSLSDQVSRTLAATEGTRRSVDVLQMTMRAHQDADLSQARFEADPDGLFTWVSHAFLRWCNRGIGQVTEHGWTNCVTQFDRERVRDEWEAAIRERREFSLRFSMCDVSGNQFEVDAYAKPIRFGSGETERWAGAITKVVCAPP